MRSITLSLVEKCRILIHKPVWAVVTKHSSIITTRAMTPNIGLTLYQYVLNVILSTARHYPLRSD